jgi:hypothetical protein
VKRSIPPLIDAAFHRQRDTGDEFGCGRGKKENLSVSAPGSDLTNPGYVTLLRL